MDYHSMKRRELQALCKEHKIPANSANSVLADKLSALLNKPASRRRTCMKSAVETTDESEPAVLRRQAKKVRFSPNNDLVEYELRSGRKEKDMVTETKHRRKSLTKKVGKPVVDNINTVELANDGAQVPVRVTRSRVQGKDDAIPINEKKQGRRAVKDVKTDTDEVKELEGNLGKVTRSKVQTLGKGDGVQLDENKQNKKAVKDVEKAGESVEGTMVGRVRVTRSKAQTLMEDSNGPNLNPKVKKKSGRRVINDVDNVEPAKEIMDVPVRVTRSRGQTLTDDAANMVAITQAVKKITRRETKISDLSNNLSNVASENNQELPRRKSSRTRGVEIATEDGSEEVGHGKRKKRSEESTADVSESQHHADKELRQSRRNRVKVEDSTALNPSVSKVEMVVDRKVTRSKVLLKMKSSEGNNKNRAKNKAEVQRESKMVQQLEEPPKQAGRKNVNRRKSVMQPENTEVVLHLDEHMNPPARKDTRRKFVMQKGKGKGIDKPLVEKTEMVKETEMVESPKVRTPKTVGKRKSKEQSGNLSVLDEGLKVDENVTGSVKGASENEMKAVGSVTGSHKSKRKRGNPVIEDQTIETLYVSPVDDSTRRSTHSTSKTEEKAVSYPRQNFVVEKQQESGLKTPASTLDNELPVESAVLEGHQSASQTTESGAIIKDSSSIRRAKSSELKPSDSEDHVETFNTEGLPVSKSENFELDGKVTEIGRTPAIEESNRRLTRSAIISERNAVVNTTPGRFTCIGINHRGNAGSRLSETVDNKKQQSQSTHQRQPLADAQMFSPEVTGVGAHPDVTNSGVIKSSNFRKKEKTPLTFQKTVLADTISVSSEISKEVEGQILECSDDLPVSESVRLPTDITEENRASMSEADIVMENVALASAENASGRAPGEVMEGAGADIEKSPVQFTCSATENETGATPYLTENPVSRKQQNSVGLPNFEDETPSGTNFSNIRTSFSMAEVSETMPDVQNENQEVYVKSATFSEGQVQVAVNIDKSVVKSGSPDEYGKETESTRSGSMSERLQTDVMVEEPAVSVPGVDISVGVVMKDENGDVDNNCDSVSYESEGPAAVCHASFEQSYNKSKSEEVEALLEPSIIKFVADDGSDAQIEKGYEQDVLTTKDPLQNPSADKHEVVENDAHDDDERASAQKQLLDESVSEDNGIHGTIDMLQSPAMGSRDVAAVVEAENMDSVLGQSTKKYASQTPVEVDNDAEANGDVPLQQSTGGDVLQGFAMGEDDIKDDMVADEDSLAKQSELSIGKNTTYVTDDEVDDGKELEPVSEPSITNDILETHISGIGIEGECDNSDALKSYPKPSTGDDRLGTSVISNDDVEDDGMNVSKELEPGLEPSNTRNTLEVLVSGNDVADDKTDGQDGESEQERLTSNNNPAMDEQDVGDDEPELAQNENRPTELEVIITSSDNEADPVLNVAVDEVPCDNASVGRPDSSTLKETPQTPATNVNNITDSIIDIHKDAVSETLCGFDGLENATGVADAKNGISYCKSEQKLKESESVSPGTSNEQRTEEAEMMTDMFGDSKEQMMTTVDHDLDSDKFMEDCSSHGVDEENIKTHDDPTREEALPIVYTKEKPAFDGLDSDRFTEDVGVHESPIPEESLPITYKKEEFDDAVSKPPTFFKDDGVNKQEETQQASTSVDWGNHSSRIDEYQKPVSAYKSDDVPDEIMKDDRVSDLQTSDRASSSMDKSCPAAGFVNSVTNLEKASRNEADGKFNQDVYMPKANAHADATDEFFNWSDSNQEDAVCFSFPDDRSCDNIGIRGSGPHDSHRQWDSEPFDDKTQDTATQSNDMYEVSHFEAFSQKYFGDEVDGSSHMSMENKKENKP